VKLPVFAAIALTLGAVAAFMAARFVGVNKAEEQASGVKVVVAEKPIEAGKPITADQIKVIDWPGTVAPPAAPVRTDDVVGRVARESMIPGEPVLNGKLAPVNATGGLSSMIPAGMRAITVQVNEVVAVAGFVLPGSYVDILVCGRDANNKPFSRTVLSRVKILAVAQETSAQQDKPKVVNAVTLELTPSDAEKLDLARNVGALTLNLRNELDTAEVHSPGARLSDIIYSQPTPSATPSPDAQKGPNAQTVSAFSGRTGGADEIRGISRNSVVTQ